MNSLLVTFMMFETNSSAPHFLMFPEVGNSGRNLNSLWSQPMPNTEY